MVLPIAGQRVDLPVERMASLPAKDAIWQARADSVHILPSRVLMTWSFLALAASSPRALLP